ncbi:hypothetical protein BP5796_08944 [Coleophoma crateriformis]|uniref:DUF7896 domain-containing protein n=1 Tax=Coleophoma crateriformis TaxID=565419 RepID=A0A3D8R2P0_9HELO|nr:hypothetical protein BP5796_08944 [Coleophoma crateriformis]
MSNITDIERKRQLLLAQLAELEAIQSTSPSNASPQYFRSPLQRHQHVPRSMSSSGTTMARHPSHRVDKTQRQRALSQHTAPGVSMARTNSRGAASARAGNLPFTNSGSVPTPVFETRREHPDVDAWVEQPFNTYTFNHQQASLEHVPEHRSNVLEDPADFLNRLGTPALSFTPSPMSMPSEAMNHRHSFSSHHAFGIQTPTTPAESLTTATTLASEMSRQNSLCNEPFIQSVEMMKFNSNSSYHPENVIDESQPFPPQYISYASRRSSKEAQSQIVFGAGASHESSFSHSFSSPETVAQFPSECLVDNMERSFSNESASSTSSTASRNKARLQAQNQHAAKRVLAPKGGSDETPMSRESSTQSVTPKNGSQDKVAISKPSYVRPKHDRVQCHQCDEHPDGFRGEHELRRHQDRVHKAMVKKWVCIEPTGQGHPKPILPLSRCKTCTHAKKKYGAYYNAAAHLRRAHFKPKAKGRSKASKNEKESEKRGGKAGGDWPPMSELKHWMIEVDEPATEFTQQQQQDEEEDEEVAEHASKNFIDNNFDFANPSIPTAYPNMHTQQMYADQGMQLDHSQQNIDMSMQFPSSTQNPGFESFPPTLLSNDASAPFMFDHSSFIDQSVGLDFVQHLNSNFSYQ